MRKQSQQEQRQGLTLKDLARYKQVTTAEDEERSQDETLLRGSLNSVDRNIMDFDHEPSPMKQTKVFFGGCEVTNGELLPVDGSCSSAAGAEQSDACSARSSESRS